MLPIGQGKEHVLYMIILGEGNPTLLPKSPLIFPFKPEIEIGRLSQLPLDLLR